MTQRTSCSPVAGETQARAGAPRHSTAYALGKQYSDDWPTSTNPDKRAARPDDGHISSAEYIHRAAARHQAAARQEGAQTGPAEGCRFDLDYHHWLEDVLGKYWMRKLLGYL